jgi:predicted ATP-dependent endonuclease of OLD family
MSNQKDAVYFKSLTIENVKCFREKQTIDFTNKNGKPAKWTVILGNNNTGKTTLLRVLADFQLKKERFDVPPEFQKEEGVKYYNLLEPVSMWLDNYFIENSSENLFAEVTFNNNNTDISLDIQSITLDHQETMFGGSSIKVNSIPEFIIVGYGTNRKSSNKLNFTPKNNFTNNLYDNNSELINAEEWLIQTDYASEKNIAKATERLENIKKVLIDILPDVKDFFFATNENFEPQIEVQTDYGWIKINDLGYGYQSLLAWVIDLAKKMFDRYPNSENPLHEPAIVLVDEIDLHLHPEWQRKIISYLSANFPNTQFIVTSHSPLVVQSADEVNVVLLKKVGDKVVIEQPEIENFQGWKIEEILRDLMDLDERVYSDTFLKLREQFDEALQENNYEKAKNAKAALDKILHPNNMQSKILEVQMAGLMPELMNH